MTGTQKEQTNAHRQLFGDTFVYGLELMTLRTLIFSATGCVTCNFQPFVRIDSGHILLQEWVNETTNYRMPMRTALLQKLEFVSACKSYCIWSGIFYISWLRYVNTLFTAASVLSLKLSSSIRFCCYLFLMYNICFPTEISDDIFIPVTAFLLLIKVIGSLLTVPNYRHKFCHSILLHYAAKVVK